MTQSKVYLIGSGPGDEDLLTLKGYKLLKQCDAVVYDRLIPDSLLKLVPETAKRVYVGKAAANHALTQDGINQLLVDLSKEYQCVVRLKGGDPYVFGRGGEEGLVLKANGVPFEVVPGISSSIGGLAYAGIPITHRGIATSFHVYTGHFKDDSSDHDWRVLAQTEGTQVFLMSIASIEHITSSLMREGKAKETPIAVVSKAATYEQNVYLATLETAKTDLPLGAIASPALLVVGEVISMRDTLNWFENQPLFGKNILVTRSSDKASKFTDALKAQGAMTRHLPMIQTVTQNDDVLDNAIQNLEHYNHLWFTSENAITRFMTRLFDLGKDARALSHMAILAIGNITATCLKQYGIVPDHKPQVFTQEGIIDLMKTKLAATDHVLIPCAEDARPYLKTETEKYCGVTVIHTYHSAPCKIETESLDFTLDSLDMITFTSGSTAKNFDAFMKENKLTLPDTIAIASIGPVTTETLQALGYTVDVEGQPHNIQGMVEAIGGYYESL